jgi:hypothetical protein
MDSLEFWLGEIQTRFSGAGGVAEATGAGTTDAANNVNAAVKSERGRNCMMNRKGENEETTVLGKSSIKKGGGGKGKSREEPQIERICAVKIYASVFQNY